MRQTSMFGTLVTVLVFGFFSPSVYAACSGTANGSGAPVLAEFKSNTNNGDYGPGAQIDIRAKYTASTNLATGSFIKVKLNTGKEITLDVVSGKELYKSYQLPASNPVPPENAEDLTVESIMEEEVCDMATPTANKRTNSPMPATNIGTTKDIIVDTTRPVLDSSFQHFINGNVLTLKYKDEPLIGGQSGLLEGQSGQMPFTTFYKMHVNGGSDVNPTSVALDANDKTKVILTFVNPVQPGDTVTLDYYQGLSCPVPAVPPTVGSALQDDASGSAGIGNKALCFSGLSIVNNAADTTSPVLLKFKSTTANGDYGVGATVNVTAEYNENIFEDASHDSRIRVKMDNNREVLLTTASGKELSGSFTVAAGDGETNDLTVAAILEEHVWDAAFNERTDSTVPVCNNGQGNVGCSSDIRIDLTKPVYVDGQAFGTKITLNYGETLKAASSSAPAGYTVSVNSTPKSVTHVNVVDQKVEITIDGQMTFNDSVHITYTALGASPKIEDDAFPDGNDAQNLDVTIMAINAGATMVVNTTSTSEANDGFCSFNEALKRANEQVLNYDPQTPLTGECAKPITGEISSIHFNIPGSGPHVINVPSLGWPLIIKPVVIDGTTQPGASCASPVVEINGSALNAVSAPITLKSQASGSTVKGLRIGGSVVKVIVEAHDSLIECNRIGLADDSGISVFDVIGVRISGNNNMIQSGNVIAGNKIGIHLLGGATGNMIKDNTIGAAGLGNTVAGIQISGSDVSDNTIQDNTISGNGDGILMKGSLNKNNKVLRNSIHGNSGLGIDLDCGAQDGFGVTANDAGDGDNGPNECQNYPTLDNVSVSGSDLVVDFTLDSGAGTYMIQFYANSSLDPSKHGEGETHIATVNGISSGSHSTTIAGAAGMINSFIVATATSGGSTSEFSETFGKFDYGDAPDPAQGTGPGNYNTVNGDFGAANMLSDYYLGKCVDEDSGDLQDTLAKADDLNVGASVKGTCTVAGDDEDGVTFWLVAQVGATNRLRVTASQPGIFNAWIDYNNDGKWFDPIEHVVVNKALVGGTQFVNFYTPNTVSTGNKYIRYRFEQDATGTSPYGHRGPGEVEDHRVNFTKIIVAEPCCKEVAIIGGDGEFREGGGTTDLIDKWNPLDPVSFDREEESGDVRSEDYLLKEGGSEIVP